jgi:hypothetical protein
MIGREAAEQAAFDLISALDPRTRQEFLALTGRTNHA